MDASSIIQLIAQYLPNTEIMGYLAAAVMVVFAVYALNQILGRGFGLVVLLLIGLAGYNHWTGGALVQKISGLMPGAF